MKQTFFVLLAVLLITACSKSYDDVNSDFGYTNLEFYADYVVEHANIDPTDTRTALSSVCNSLDFIVYTVDNGSYSVYTTIRQSKTDADYGHIRLDNVPYGNYIVIAVGHNCSQRAVFYSPLQVDFGGKVAETFVAYMELCLDNNTAASQVLTLKRNTAMFVLKALDAQPADIATLEFLITGASTDFNPSTGLAYTTDITVRTVTMNLSGAAGESGLEYYFHMFLPSKDATVSIVANFKDAAGNILLTRSFPSAEMTVNEKTIYKGHLYSSGSTFSMDVNDEWDGENTFSI